MFLVWFRLCCPLSPDIVREEDPNKSNEIKHHVYNSGRHYGNSILRVCNKKEWSD